jgi:hypothetical protein
MVSKSVPKEPIYFTITIQAPMPTPTLIIVIPSATLTPVVETLEVYIVPDTPEPSIMVLPVTEAEQVIYAQSVIETYPMAEISYFETPLPAMPEFVYESQSYIVPTPAVDQYVGIDLDAMWDMVASSGMADDWSDCVYPLPVPFVTWGMAVRASELQADRHSSEEISISSQSIAAIMAEGGGSFPLDGNVRLPENNVMSMLYPYYQGGLVFICRDLQRKPTVYGNGINLFLNDLYIHYKDTQ